MPTVICGVKCSDGVLIVADRRVTRGLEFEEEKKIFQPFTGVVVGATGLTGITDKFLREVQIEARIRRVQNLDEAIEVIEDVVGRLQQRYAKRLFREKEAEKGLIEILVGGLEYLTHGNAQLYHVLPEGYAEAIKRYLIIGHGESYAQTLMKALYRENAKIENMLRVAIFPIVYIEELGLDTSVGGLPQVYVVKHVEQNQEGGLKELSDEEVQEIVNSVKPLVNKIRNLFSET